MKLEVYRQVLDKLGEIIKGTEFEGHVYTVGGCERDRLLGYDIKDIDLVVDLPNGGINLANWLFEQGRLLYAPVTYENYGTAMFHLKDMPEIELEAVQTRKESYRDMTTRNPETAYGTIYEDCMRRDFTMNALYRTVGTDELHDFTGRSLDDIKARVIRSCDDPDIIFKEDSLRILRAIRFSSKLGWDIEKATYDGMLKNVYRLEIISKERITDEFNKILISKDYSRGLFDLLDIGALTWVSSYFRKITREQFSEAVSSMRWTVENSLNRLAILMMYVTDPEWAMREMKYSLDDINYVMMLLKEVPVIQSLGPTYKDISYVDIRRQQHRVGDVHRLFNAIEVAHSINNKDCYTTRKNMQAMHVMAANIKLIRDYKDCFGYKLPVDGNDVMDFKNIKPSPKVKKYLDYLMEEAYKDPSITRKQCFEIISKLDF